MGGRWLGGERRCSGFGFFFCLCLVCRCINTIRGAAWAVHGGAFLFFGGCFFLSFFCFRLLSLTPSPSLFLLTDAFLFSDYYYYYYFLCQRARLELANPLDYKTGRWCFFCVVFWIPYRCLRSEGVAGYQNLVEAVVFSVFFYTSFLCGVFTVVV